MGLIIDANRASDFKAPFGKHATIILDGIRSRKVKIIVGGHLLRELSQTPILPLIAEWRRIGVLQTFPNVDVDKMTASIKSFKLKSNDGHVIALAIVSKSRLLYSDDLDLMKDFKNGKLLSPKGKVIRPKTPHKIALNLLNQHGK